jgi:hypothetical protein
MFTINWGIYEGTGHYNSCSPYVCLVEVTQQMGQYLLDQLSCRNFDIPQRSFVSSLLFMISFSDFNEMDRYEPKLLMHANDCKTYDKHIFFARKYCKLYRKLEI